MAGYWISLEEGFADHPKVYKLASKLDICEAHARGLMVSLWLWSITNALSGDLTQYTNRAIAKAADWDGDADEFVAALVDCAWMDKLDDGRKTLHGWQERVELLVRTIEYKREQGRIRQQHLRERRMLERSTLERRMLEPSTQMPPKNADGEWDKPLIIVNDGTSDATGCVVTREGNARNGITKPLQPIEEEEEYLSTADAPMRYERTREAQMCKVNDETVLRGDFAEVYRDVLGLEATPEEIEGCIRFVRMGVAFELIEEAFKRAARYHAKNPYPFAAECLGRWRKEGIATVDQVADEDYNRDAMNGKHGSAALKEAFEWLRKKTKLGAKEQP